MKTTDLDTYKDLNKEFTADCIRVMNNETEFREILRTVFGDFDKLLSNVEGHAYKTDLWARESISGDAHYIYILAHSYESCGYTIIYKYMFTENTVQAVLNSALEYAEEHHFCDLPYETVGEMYINSIKEGWKAKEAVLKIHDDEYEHLLQDAEVEMYDIMTDKLH